LHKSLAFGCGNFWKYQQEAGRDFVKSALVATDSQNFGHLVASWLKSNFIYHRTPLRTLHGQRELKLSPADTTEIVGWLLGGWGLVGWGKASQYWYTWAAHLQIWVCPPPTDFR